MFSFRISAVIAAAALVLLASSLSSRSGGVESGDNAVPGNSSSQMPSCQHCHSNSGPFPSRTNGPTTTIVVNDLVLQPNQQTTVTTSVTGGAWGSDGGFLCEASAGTFTAGGQTLIITNPASITHSNDNNRSWTYTFTAPATPGLVTLTSAGLSANGSGSGGDVFSFSGFDPNATVATPTRLFVLPQSVVNQGVACPDGFGNYSVLGANGVPNLGNQSFALELHGATPGSIAFLVGGFNPPGFNPIDLGGIGLPGCQGTVANSLFTLTGFTSGGSAQRAEGFVNFPLPVISSPLLQGVILDLQSAYVDPTATQAPRNRSMTLSVSNGLAVTFL